MMGMMRVRCGTNLLGHYYARTRHLCLYIFNVSWLLPIFSVIDCNHRRPLLSVLTPLLVCGLELYDM
jgi:hypothetical protein